jgi:hypothetical protein
MKKRRGYIKESRKDEGGPAGAAPNDGQGDDHAALAKHHKALAEHHGALAEEHAKFVDVETIGECGCPPGECECPPGAEAPYGDPEEGDVVGLGAGESSEKPPDTIETAKYEPAASEEGESPEHEAGETKEVEAVEHGRKPAPKGGRSFRPFKKGGSFKF